MASLSTVYTASLPLRTRPLVDGEALDGNVNRIVHQLDARHDTIETRMSEEGPEDGEILEGDIFDDDPTNPTPYSAIYDASPIDTEGPRILDEIEEITEKGPEALNYYWSSATYQWCDVNQGQVRAEWHKQYEHVRLVDLARQMKALLDKYGADHPWKREPPLLEFCIEHNFVLQDSFQAASVPNHPGPVSPSPDIFALLQERIKDQPVEMRDWCWRAIEAVRQPGLLLRKAPKGHFGIRYGNPYVRISQREVVDWMMRNISGYKARTDWRIEPLPQERMLNSQRWLQMLRWQRWIETFPMPSYRLDKMVEKSYQQRAYLCQIASQLLFQLGINIMPVKGDFGDFKFSHRRLLGELCEAIKPMFDEQWRRFMACCERIIDEPEHMATMRRDRDRAKQALVAKMEIIEPPFPNAWPGLGFGGRAGGIHGHYHLLTHLSAGSFGKTSLYVQYDANGRICDRIVTKDAPLQANNSEGSHFVTWGGADSGHLLHEAFFMRRLGQLKTSDYFPIIEYQSQAIFQEAGGAANFYRLFMKQAVHGDMHDMLDKQSRHLQLLKGRRDRDGNIMPRRIIPPLAIWAFFEGLATAACLMKRGALPCDPSPPDWEALVHLDIKPLNIFLTKPHDVLWPDIPQIKLGDFGAMTLVDHPSRRNPSQSLCGQGTYGFIAPERMPDEHSNYIIRDLRIDSGADIFSIGITILTLMLNEEADLEQVFIGPSAERATLSPFERLDPEERQQVHDDYGPKLLSLVNQCIWTEPSERITAEQLWEEVFRETRKVDKPTDVPMYLQRLPRDQVLLLRPDKYADLAA